MESQFNLVLDVNVELELIQVDFYGRVGSSRPLSGTRFKTKTNKSKIWGQPKKY